MQGGGFYEEGEFVPISALPHPGYLFSHWLGSGIENPLRGQTSILLESDSLIVASFSLSDLSAFLNCESLGNQWFSSWMGTIYQTDSGWIYHAQLGWLYPQIHSSGIWLWKENIGWMWTKENTYLRNFLWIDHSQNWGYVDFEKAEGIRWFDYQTSSWMDWPH